MNIHRFTRVFKTVLICALAVSGFSCDTPKRAKARSGWRPIFDGKTTEGWRVTAPGEFKLERGELVTHGGMGLLWDPAEKFGNCRSRGMFKPVAADDNSGVFIRIPEPPKDPWDAVNH